MISRFEFDRNESHPLPIIIISGIFFVLPCIESYQKVDLRTITLGVPPQEVSRVERPNQRPSRYQAPKIISDMLIPTHSLLCSEVGTKLGDR